MLFNIFNNEEDRREYGGSAFMEMQFCTLPTKTKINELVKVSNIKNWKNDSLYINDINLFYNEYREIFNYGIYNNLKSGVFDAYGINYYAPNNTVLIIERLKNKKPIEYDRLIEWLNMSMNYNGFYILGI